MKLRVFLFLLTALPFLVTGQNRNKNTPPSTPYKVPVVPATKILPDSQPVRLSKSTPNSIPKRASDRELDSIYHNVYHMDVPMFYEETETHRPKQ